MNTISSHPNVGRGRAIKLNLNRPSLGADSIFVSVKFHSTTISRAMIAARRMKCHQGQNTVTVSPVCVIDIRVFLPLCEVSWVSLLYDG